MRETHNLVWIMIIYGRPRTSFLLNKLPKDQHRCKRLRSNRIQLLDVKERISSLHTLRNVTPLISQPWGFSMASHGNINLKEGNNSGHRPKQEKSLADQ
jgi:hypothetical protein